MLKIIDSWLYFTNNINKVSFSAYQYLPKIWCNHNIFLKRYLLQMINFWKRLSIKNLCQWNFEFDVNAKVSAKKEMGGNNTNSMYKYWLIMKRILTSYTTFMFVFNIHSFKNKHYLFHTYTTFHTEISVIKECVGFN